MTFPECVLYQKAIQIFKTIRGNAPEYLRTSFTFATDIHAIRLRSSSSYQFYTPKPHLEIYRNTFVFIRFGILFLHISKTQTQFSILNLSSYVG